MNMGRPSFKLNLTKLETLAVSLFNKIQVAANWECHTTMGEKRRRNHELQAQ
jgi:hypothetical protein